MHTENGKEGKIIMKIKKWVATALAGLMICTTLTGCTSYKDRNAVKTTQTLKAAPTVNTENDSKVLVVYYSASGNTERVAKNIAEETGGDLFELVPTEIYTGADLDWTDKNSRVTREHENSELRDIELEYNTVENWESYDTIFIGYPIWWGIAAWPVNSFVQLNDFTGKTVIPFATSASSGIGESGELLEKQAGTGEWQTGKRFRSGISEDEVKTWVQDLGLQEK